MLRKMNSVNEQIIYLYIETMSISSCMFRNKSFEK